ncbi:hypothetical protein SEVIR_7G109200v4 [Setaria viridis]|uniref:Uncharacterized protein n=1 Tax=Setaria viridis TaxID=4556 RepID=A0A4U6TTM0_SETVI|nr:putative protein TPRXL [Setaria viridis]TKW04443.1 hypothetical protein SEVIR_7G109200v2 [Setaria viridis]
MPNPSSSPPVPAPAAATRRRRRRRQLLPSSTSSSNSTVPTSTSGTSASSTSSSSSSSASSGLSFSFPSFSPAPSPFHHRFLSPLRASAVPFSWEHRPGIPKTPARQAARGKAAAAKAAAGTLPLPLPPSLLSSKVGAADDPFSASDGYLIVPDDAKARRRQRRSPALAATLTDWLAVLSIYRSCTRSRDCLAGTPPPRPRPRPRSPAKAA